MFLATSNNGYYGVILNRTYRVYVTDLYLCAARVRGLLASPLSLNEEWYNPEFYVHQSLATQYDQIDPTSPAFLAQDRANFQLARLLSHGSISTQRSGAWVRCRIQADWS